MKKFNLIVVLNEEISGVGYYQKTSNGLIIEAEDYAVKDYFLESMRSKSFIGSIHFTGAESDSVFAGKFIVTNISNDSIILTKI